ncbi:hypothetical protein O6P43_002580 [Quillaja saponaria]|uniref:Uncharacterized protein n=1 Tax=Quillaja saponaria TaxID=32244 RepID=A0AAD7QCU7_QUISA|nr:hypothetical protein O6P43_002580 [Quillaja saponaria]
MSRSMYVATRMVHRLFFVLTREPKRRHLLPTILDFDPGILPLSNWNQPPHHCIALEQLSGRGPVTLARYICLSQRQFLRFAIINSDWGLGFILRSRYFHLFSLMSACCFWIGYCYCNWCCQFVKINFCGQVF